MTLDNVNKLEQKINWKKVAVFYSVLLFLMNFIRIFDDNFWADEAYSIRLTRMNILEILIEVANDNHPPLYHIILGIFVKIFGSYGYVYHFVSLLPYAIFLLFCLAKIWKDFGKGPTFFVITISSILNTSVRFNVEVRMYSWATLFVFLSYYYLYSIFKNNDSKSYALLIFFALCAAFTHYYCVIIESFLYLGLLIYSLLTKRINIKNVAIVYITTFLLYLPWAIVLFKTIGRVNDNFWIDSIPSFLESALYYFYNPYYQIYGIIMIMIFVIILFVVLIKKGNINNILQNNKIIWIMIGIISVAGTISLVRLYSKLVKPLFDLRYIYPFSYIVWIDLGVLLSLHSKKYLTAFVIALTLLFNGPLYVGLVVGDYDANIECQQTKETMSNLFTDKTVLLSNNYFLSWTVLDYYFPNLNHVYINDDFSNFDKSKDLWMAWSKELNNQEIDWLNKNNLKPSEVIQNALLGDTLFFLYKLDNIN